MVEISAQRCLIFRFLQGFQDCGISTAAVYYQDLQEWNTAEAHLPFNGRRIKKMFA